MLDASLVEAIASELGTKPGFIEKDWHVVRALSVIAQMDHGVAQPVFSGGTALSKGWQLIERFSEDIDFKVVMPADATKQQRSDYRRALITVLEAAGFTLNEKPLVADGSRFFQAKFLYPSIFPVGPGQRPHLQVEMTFDAPSLKSIQRPLQSFVSLAQQQRPEVPEFPCVDPVETAADKLSALAWRACTRDRSASNDDPTTIRHLHDLAALEQMVQGADAFIPLVQEKAEIDSKRGGGQALASPADRFADMLQRLQTDPLWEKEYEEFVRQVSFARPENAITFQTALDAVTRLVARYVTEVTVSSPPVVS